MKDMNINRTNINNLYFSSLRLMEENAKEEIVRSSLLEVATYLNMYAKTSPIYSKEAYNKANLLLKYAKKIREDHSYNEVYYLLTGKRLMVKKEDTLVEAPVIKEEIKIEPINKEEKHFKWNLVSDITFKDVAGLEKVKEEIKSKVVLPLTNPDLFEGYQKKNGGGLLLYGPPGTGKTMIGAAIANELHASFCSISPSDLLTRGVGESEKLIKQLFYEARQYDVAIIYFEEMESLCPKSTHSQVSRQIRSELLTQIQGLGAYQKDNGKILYLIASTNKPWDIDPAFIRPGRFGTRVYIDLPDEDARRYLINHRLDAIKEKGVVLVDELDIDYIVNLTEGYSGADITYLLDEVEEISIKRALDTNIKEIKQDDFLLALNKVTSSIQKEDIEKLENWKKENNG